MYFGQTIPSTAMYFDSDLFRACTPCVNLLSLPLSHGPGNRGKTLFAKVSGSTHKPMMKVRVAGLADQHEDGILPIIIIINKTTFFIFF